MCSLSTNDLKRIFEKLDKNGDGLVSLDELNWLLERIGVQLSLTELESLVKKPSLNFEEFLFFYGSISNPNCNNKNRESNSGGDVHDDHRHHEDEEDSDLVKAFKVFDLNDDGFISGEELQSVLIRLGFMDDQNSGGRDKGKSMIGAFDTNSDGQLDFEEFKNMMLPTG